MPSPLETLINHTISSEAFKISFKKLEEDAAEYQILNRMSAPMERKEILKIIKISSLIALGTEVKYKRLSQKLNSLLFNILGTDILVNYAVQIISSRLGNIPAITLSTVFKENNIYQFSETANTLESQFIADPEIVSNLYIERLLSEWKIQNKSYFFNLEQREIIQIFDEKSLVSFSAPTSFGKSYVVRFHISRLYSERKLKRTLIIVPTKSLIDDFLESFLDFKRDLNLSFSIHTHARNVTEENTSEESIFILTQERVSFLLSQNPNFVKTFNLIYCDEAHCISRGYRGFVLREVLKKLINLCGVHGIADGHARYIFTSPLIKNPNYYQNKLFPQVGAQHAFHAEILYSPVEKNLYLVEKNDLSYQYFLLKESSVNITFKKRLYKIGDSVDLNFINHIGDEEISSDIAIVLDKKIAGKNILYVTSPLVAHKYGLALSQSLPVTEYANDPEIVDIQKYIKDHFSPDFNLIDMIKKGVGLHYGPMPVGLRRAMVQLYENGKISYLICTSTLLEGVNLPANNIFIFSPNRDKKSHTPLSFWNLVGRAGRITYGLSGNVICIGKKVTEYKKLIEDKESEIEDPEKESLQTATRQLRLIETFVNNDFSYTKSDIRNDIEFLIYELLTKVDFLNIIKSTSLSEEQINQVLPYIQAIRDQIEIPIEILEKNPGIDPRLQNNLYLYLKEGQGREKLLNLFSVAQNPRGITGDKISLILDVTHSKLKWPLQNYEVGKISKKTAQWLQEMSVADFIEQRTRYVENSENPEVYFAKIKIAVEIIQNLDNVSFLAPKYIKCLFDIGMFILREASFPTEELNENVESFLFSIEAGVSSVVARYLYEKGVSRSIAIKAGSTVEEIIINEGFDEGFFNKDSVKTKLKNNLSNTAYKELMDHLA